MCYLNHELNEEKKSLPLEMWFESQNLLNRIRKKIDLNHMTTWFDTCLYISFGVHIGTCDSNQIFSWLASHDSNQVANSSFYVLTQVILSFD